MAYENYSFVSWTTGTPITGERLAQVSTNIEQVKDATDDKPQGILKLKQTSTNSSTFSDFDEHELIKLADESGSSGPDNRVSVDGNRYYKLVLNFPGFHIKGSGMEDSTYKIRVYSGTFGSANTLVTTWSVTPHTFDFYDTASTPGTTSTTVKSVGYDSVIGTGTYSYVLSSTSSGLTGESFFVTVDRDAGSGTSNAPDYFIRANVSTVQFYVEDSGGV